MFFKSPKNLKKLAGVESFKGLTPYSENLSYVGNKKSKTMKKKNIKPSAPRAKRIRGKSAPRKCDPTSPIIIFAGFVFHHKKPKHAPATAEINWRTSVWF